jgi:D-alanine-D-alanine ligase
MEARMTDAPLTLALVFGGRSGEHDVSVVSARSVDRALDRDRYRVVPMAIDRTGRWADADTAARVLASSGDRADEVAAFEGVHAVDPRLLDGSVDVVVPILHGPFGEDGTVQGMLEMLDLPYVGCDSGTSALCMDKRMTKRVLAWASLPTAPWIEVEVADWRQRPDAIRRDILELGLPVFVKPCRLGSSVGISKVRGLESLDDAIAEAFAWDDAVIVEQGLDAREIEVAVLGNDTPRAAVPGEVVPGHEFYDYADKYLDDDCQLLAPAPLDDDQITGAQDLAIRVFRLLGCTGMARVDLFLERSSDRWWVNEVNTIPGFTSISMFPRLWGVSGLEYPALLDELVRLALERHRRRTSLRSA